MLLRYHDDDRCGELLDAHGKCPKHDFVPDVQHVGLKEVPDKIIRELKRKGRTLLSSSKIPLW